MQTFAFGQSLSSAVNYSARDSIVADVKSQIIKLYGEAVVTYEDVELNADYIEVDLKKSEVMATYTVDSLGLPVGKPLFTSAGESSTCDYIRYNFNTKTGYVKEVRAQQDEGYIHMSESKIHPNEQVHLYDGKFTTCDADTPHYHFKLTRAIIVPDERIVTGPVYMKIFKVPTPLAAPFAFFPNSDTKKNGIIIPRFANTNEYGFGLQDFGYYLPLGDYWETYFYATIFTTGRFGIENRTNYYRKYKFNGSAGVKFEQFRGKFYNPDITNKWTVSWKHVQDSKAHPTIKFNSDINFISDNNPKNSLQAIIPDYYNNQFNSAINLTKRFTAGKLSGTMGLKTSLQQNTQSKNYTIDLPTFNISVNQFDLGVLRSVPIGKKWYENIKVSYSMNARNFISAPDSIFNNQYLFLVNDYARNGVQQNAVIQSNLRLFGSRVTFSPVINYTELWNFQYETNQWNPLSEKIDTTEVSGFKSSRTISFNAVLNSNFFGYYKMAGKKQMKFRHVASPSVSFQYRPDIGLYSEIQIDTAGNTKFYSPFQSSLYRESGFGNAGIISFSLANTLEMKMRDKKDSINDSFKSFKLIDAFSINGNYDIFKDSFNLSDFSFAFRTARFLQVFSFQSGAILTPYSYDETTGIKNKEYAWTNNQGIGRFSSANAAVNANFTNKTGRKKQEEIDNATSNDANINEFATNPNQMNFEIPWQLNLSYNFNLRRGPIKNTLGDFVDSLDLVQTLKADGDFSITENWKFRYSVSFDLEAQEPKGIIPFYSFSVWRNLHCWEASLEWVQYGPWEGFNQQTNINILFRVNIKAAMFQDIKLDYQGSPFFW